MDTKSIIANNLIELRKSRKWTQIELAERLNYSDKAISKWERAESLRTWRCSSKLPICFLYLWIICLKRSTAKSGSDFIGKITISSATICDHTALHHAVFLIATIVFVIFGLLSVSVPIWMAYIYAIPVACIVLIVFNSIWGKSTWNYVFISMLLWTLLMAAYLPSWVKEAGWSSWLASLDNWSSCFGRDWNSFINERQPGIIKFPVFLNSSLNK